MTWNFLHKLTGKGKAMENGQELDAGINEGTELTDERIEELAQMSDDEWAALPDEEKEPYMAKTREPIFHVPEGHRFCKQRGCVFPDEGSVPDICPVCGNPFIKD